MARKKIKLNTDQRSFSITYHDSIDSDVLENIYQLALFIALKRFTDGNNKCFPSLKKLAKVSRMSQRKVQKTLKELEKKHIISIENRARTDGGDASNLYTLYDFKELWCIGNNVETTQIIKQEETERAIKLLEGMGFTIIKQKESTSVPTKVTKVDPNKNASNVNKDNTNKVKSQAERYTIGDIKALFEYDSLIIQYPKKQIDIEIVFDILYDTLNCTKPTIRVGGEDKPAMAVIGKFMKLQPDDLIYSIDKYHEQSERIKNVKGYLLTILYNSHEQSHLDIMNLGHHNGDF